MTNNTSEHPEANTLNNNGGNANPPQSPTPPYKDKDGNEITPAWKFLSGIFLVLLTLFSLVYLIGHWPDRLVSPRDNVKPLYTYKWFHVRLAGIPDTGSVRYLNDSIVVVDEYGLSNLNKGRRDTIVVDTIKEARRKDSAKRINDSLKAVWKQEDIQRTSSYGKAYPQEQELMHINTLLLILVALAGFLGNMIYIASSFTTYIGNGQFRKSWNLWYCVKPFTAAALAVAIYFVFRGGFLNMSDDSTNINLYGLMTISILAGLFTDRTTLKLKEVFDVLLRPREERSDPLEGNKPLISDIEAPLLEVGQGVLIKITGKNLDKKSLIVKIDGKEIGNVNRQPSIISFSYTLPSELKDKDALRLEIVDDKGVPVHHPTELKVKKGSGATGNNGNAEYMKVKSPFVDENQEEFGDPDTDDDINKPQD
jgi:hypothetical protein